MLFKKKAVTLTALLLCVCTICFFAEHNSAAKPTSSQLGQRPKIILDAGHGGLTNTID